MKVINYTHLMPTRYSLDVELKSVVTLDTFKEPTQRIATRKAVKKVLEDRFNSGKNKWFFSKLRF
jgi:large subunit ribosomal protein L27e